MLAQIFMVRSTSLFFITHIVYRLVFAPKGILNASMVNRYVIKNPKPFTALFTVTVFNLKTLNNFAKYDTTHDTLINISRLCS